MDVKILIALHKPFWVPNDDVYFPLALGGKKISNTAVVTDDTGENISAKNDNYCELTGLYWAWKNLRCDYVGLCHYRRYFARNNRGSLFEKRTKILGRKEYEKLLQQYDIILPQKRHYYIETVRSQYEHAHYKKDLEITQMILNRLYPEYSTSFNIVMNSRSLYILNMFVMSKSLFDEYCQWLFPILFEAEEKIDVRSYSNYEARVFGFLAERLFNVWLEKKQLKRIEVPVAVLEPVNWKRKVINFLARKFELGGRRD